MSGYFAHTAEDRAAYLNGLRDLLEFLQTHPDVPVTSGTESIQLSTFGKTMAERTQTVDEFAALVGAEPQWMHGSDTHYGAVVTFGPVKYFCVAIRREDDEPDAESETDGPEPESCPQYTPWDGRLGSACRTCGQPGPPHDPDLAAASAAWHAQHPGECCPNAAWCRECATAVTA